MIEPTDEMRRIVAARMGIPDGAGLDPWMEAAIGDVLAIVERSLPRCPYVEWGFKVRLCSLPFGHDGDHDLEGPGDHVIKPTDEMVTAAGPALYGYSPLHPTARKHIRKALAAALPIFERDQAARLARIKVSIDMHDGGCGRFIARVVLNCTCGAWGITLTLAAWSNLASVSASARLHLDDCRIADSLTNNQDGGS